MGLVIGLEGIRLQIHLEKLVKLEIQEHLKSPSGMAFRLSKRCISEMWSRTVKSKVDFLVCLSMRCLTLCLKNVAKMLWGQSDSQMSYIICVCSSKKKCMFTLRAQALLCSTYLQPKHTFWIFESHNTLPNLSVLSTDQSSRNED